MAYCCSSQSVSRKSESTADDIAKLRRLVQHCQLGYDLSDALGDSLRVLHTNEHTQMQLLTETDLTLKCAIKTVVSTETAVKDVTELQNKQVLECQAHKLAMKAKEKAMSKQGMTLFSSL